MSQSASACQGEQADDLIVDISSDEKRSGFTEDDIAAFFVAWRKRTYRTKSIANRDDVAQLIVALISDGPALKRARSAPDFKGRSFERHTVVSLDLEDDFDDDLGSSYTSAEEISISTDRTEPPICETGSCLTVDSGICIKPANADDSQKLEVASTGVHPVDNTSDPSINVTRMKNATCETPTTRDSGLSSPKIERSCSLPALNSSRLRCRDLRASCSSPTPTASSSDVHRHSMIDLSEINYRQARSQPSVQQLPEKGKAVWSPLASDAGSRVSLPSIQVPNSDDMPLAQLRALLQRQCQESPSLHRTPPAPSMGTVAEGITRTEKSECSGDSTFDAAQAAYLRAQWFQQLDGGGRSQRLPLLEDQIRQEMIVEHRNAKLRALHEARQRQARQSIENALLRTPYMEDLRRQAMRKMQADANNRYEKARAELMAENARLQAEEEMKQVEKIRRIEDALSRMHVKVSLSRFRNL